MWAPVGGVPIVLRLRDALRAAGLEPVLVAPPSPAADVAGLPCRPDLHPGQGPLAGLETALAWAAERGEPGAVCVACDLPHLPAGLLRALAERGTSTDADVVAPASPRNPDGEPLCAWYGTHLLPTVVDRLERDERGVLTLLARLQVDVLPLDRVRRWGEPDHLFLNVNTPADRERAEHSGMGRDA